MAMQNNYRHAFLASLCCTAILSVWRTVITPYAEAATVSYGILAAVTVLAVIGLLVWCGLRTESLHTPQGLPAMCMAVATALTGALLTVSSAFIAQRWFVRGEMPFPQKLLPTVVDTVFLYGLIFSGFFGGVCFLFLAARWLQRREAFRGMFPLAVLLPLVWTWFRLLRFEISHVSTLGLFRNVFDLGMLAAEMLFFLSFARYVSGVAEERKPRFFVGIALCTGMLCTVSVLTKFAMLCSQEAAAFSESALVTAPDLGVAVLAFATAFGQTVASQPQNREETEPEETAVAPQEEPVTEEEQPRRPLEIEDIINDIIEKNYRKS